MSREGRLRRFAHLPLLELDLDILPAPQRGLWQGLGDIPDDFVLYGGTGLALRLGHRESLDFDFFSAGPFAPPDLLRDLAWLGRVEIIESAPDTLTLRTGGGVRLSFLGGLQRVAEPSVATDNGLVVASIYDLAGTKAKALRPACARSSRTPSSRPSTRRSRWSSRTAGRSTHSGTRAGCRRRRRSRRAVRRRSRSDLLVTVGARGFATTISMLAPLSTRRGNEPDSTPAVAMGIDDFHLA